jgi:hypothetical protein
MNIEKNRRTASVALSTILVLLLLLGTPLIMFSLTVVAAAADEEEDPVKISYDGNVYSSPPGPTLFTVCVGQSFTFQVVVFWFQPPDPSKVQWVYVQMVDRSGYGISFSPSNFYLYNPSPDSQTVNVNVPAFGSTGTFQLQIYADTVNQGSSSTPNVAGTNMYFQVEVVDCPPPTPQTLTLSCSGPDAQSPCTDTGDIGPRDTGTYVLSYTITANEDLTDVRVQGGITVKAKNIKIYCDGTTLVWSSGSEQGWPSGTVTVSDCAGGQLTINTSKKNNVLTWTFTSMDAGESHTLTIEFDWTPTSSGTQSIAGEWSAVCTSSQGTTKTPYTPRVWVEV